MKPSEGLNDGETVYDTMVSMESARILGASCSDQFRWEGGSACKSKGHLEANFQSSMSSCLFQLFLFLLVCSLSQTYPFTDLLSSNLVDSITSQRLSSCSCLIRQVSEFALRTRHHYLES